MKNSAMLLTTAVASLIASSACFAARAGADYADGTERFDNGWYAGHLPVPVLHVEGGIEEVARAHGALLARHPEMRETLEYFSGVVQHKLDSNPALANHRWIAALIEWGYRHFIRNLLLDYLPDRYRAAYEEFAKAAGVKTDMVLDAVVVPDAALRLRSLLYPIELAPDLPANLGCTSIIWNAGPSSTLHGRNLDYDGVGYWNRFPLILHVIPNEGLAYVAVTSAGIHAPGLTAFNEAGLTLAVHQLTLSDSQASGTPMPVISAEIIRNARSIDDAIAIIRGFPRAGSWAYVLSQGRDRAVIETSASDVVIRRSGEPFFYQTNHVSSPALAAEQFFSSPGSWIDSFSRASRLQRLVQSGAVKGWATPERMAAILGSGRVQGAPNTTRRIAGGTIAKLDNIQSVIMDAGHRRLWVAIGTDRRAPNENRFVEYRWGDMRSADEPELTGAEVTVSPVETLGTTGARLRELLRQSVDQRRLDHDPGARHAFLSEYARAAQASGLAAGPMMAPATGSWAGLYLHVWDELSRGPRESTPPDQLLQDINFALRDPDLTAGLSTPPTDLRHTASLHRLALGRLTRGWLLDLLARRGEALAEYSIVANTAEFERLKRAAQHGLRHAFDWERASELAIDVSGIDLFQY